MSIGEIYRDYTRPMPSGVWQLLCAQYFLLTFYSITVGALFDAYLLVLQGSNTFVGGVATIGGLAAVTFAMPVGWALDRWDKSLMLRGNAIFGVCATVILIFAILSASTPLIVVGFVAMSIHQQFFGVTVPVLITQLTVPGDERTRAFGNSQSSMSLGQASGPAIQLIFTYVLKTDEWKVDELQRVLLVGVVFFAPYIWFAWRVKNAAEANVLHHQQAGVSMVESPVGDEGSGATKIDNKAEEIESADSETPCYHWIVAALIECCGVFTAIGSGMTFKFWPLFFKGDFGFNPSQVCIMQFGIWLAIAIGAQMATPISRVIGRLLTCMVTHYSATALLFVIASYEMSTSVTVCLVILRNMLMNMNSPLLQSILMDYVPAKHRGKWTAFMSLKRMSWSGSAFIGGFLSDTKDYRYAFFITALAHTGSGAFLFFVRCFTKA